MIESEEYCPRLSVLINEESAAVLRAFKENHGVSTTEAIRRAIGLMSWMEDNRRQGHRIILETRDGVFLGGLEADE
jgi:hypothetical protein